MRIQTPSRIHMGLIDLNGSIGRVDGGIGLSLEEPNIKIKGKESNDISIEFEKNLIEKFGEEYLLSIKQRAKTIAERILNFINENGVDLKITSLFPAHSGLGSGTQLALGIGKLISKLYNRDLNGYEIAKIAGRGGTSGIGIGAFEYGGFLIDGGHSFGKGKDKEDFKPSSASKGVKPAPIIFRHEFDWDVVLIIPKGEHVYGKKEVDIFKKYCPVPLNDVEKICHLVLMKMMPAVVEKNLDDFGEVVNKLQYLGFKKVELSLQSDIVKNLINELHKDVYAGLSSFGPTIYAFGDKKLIIEKVNNVFDKYGVYGDIIITKVNNIGYKIF
ncbi:beta-ribofuranosylaminobenzene 5'-phosphate synthase family [Methanocaldococcus vulcanius M7]|uniref:Beta-ribofuranosylaminobenzene 5'-phosphate synthase n=1 Tax=Methanocaldococcus vulcanius (strain ATCC 700851 / DSM 12094 / M7) TaxID=579137 RepID=C9RG96_METVM|nr:beta-ribofuranosylaminobenzene 5'-phosphate synthase [Methanocaldococcus vulcanius]ACX72598.1 beta-ribofuranosylaminobenzene 5'-phosphate synthase family [Methanocaldococcus vulcanius M7]